MTAALKITGTALALTAVVAGTLIAGLAYMIHTRERKLATWAGDDDGDE